MTIGDKLRQAREAQAITLHDIANKTNISVRFLDALEKGQVEKLPGGIFTRGFVRSYASQVGIDPDDAVRQYVAAHPGIGTDEDVENTQPSQSTVPLLVGGLILLLLLLGAGYLWWQSRGAARVSGPAGQASAAAATVVGDGAVGAEGSVPESVPPAVAAAAPPPAAVEAGAGGLPATPTEPTVTRGLPLRLTLVPTGRCWVQVRADGRVRLAREVQQGERVDIEAAELLEIVAGDAGAFGYRLNGAPGRALGMAGRVGRARITLDNLAEFQQNVS